MLKERKDIDQKYKWDLTVLYADEKAFFEDYSKAEKMIKAFKKHEATMCKSAENLYNTLKDMYENDFTFSYLFPFSTEYYRKFGYEVAGVAHEWTLSLRDIKPRDVGGSMEQLFPGDDMSPLLEIYNKCFADVNMSALRDTYSAELNEKNFMNDMRYVYLWRNDDGEPRGLMISKKTEDGGETLLNCTHTFGCRCGFLFCDIPDNARTIPLYRFIRLYCNLF